MYIQLFQNNVTVTYSSIAIKGVGEGGGRTVRTLTGITKNTLKGGPDN